MDRYDIAHTLPLGSVTVGGPFWAKILDTVRESVIPYQWEALNDRVEGAEKSHGIMNFRIAAGEAQGAFGGLVFQDSDLAKWLEAVGYSLGTHPDPALECKADEAIDLIVKAQRQDGYTNTYFTLVEPEKRWTNLLECHELYCAGHLIEGAVAYYQGTGKRKFLDAMCRYADYIDSIFGPEPGKLKGCCGHPEIELALVKLYRTTGVQRYLRLAKYFIDERGQEPRCFEAEWERRGRISHWTQTVTEEPNRVYNQNGCWEYNQCHLPVRQQALATGHAVRAAYLYAGMADVAAETGDAGLLEACRSLWENVATKQMYITGGIGSTPQGEAFTFDYDLPNDTVYAETCASIALIFFSHRMLLLEQDSRYADVIEKALYNVVIGSMDQGGKHFFYVNPLEVWPEASVKNPERCHAKPVRQKWFGCACCPTNLTRLLSSLGSYVYTVHGGELAVHLYIEGDAELDLNGQTVKLRQSTDYPWKGKSVFTVSVRERAEFTLSLRIPGWCRNFSVKVSGKTAAYHKENGYAKLRRSWDSGDAVEVEMPMPVELVYAHPSVRADAGKAAVQRGPLVYCIEQADNGENLAAISLMRNTRWKTEAGPGLPGGAVTITGQAYRLSCAELGGDLYRFDEPKKTTIRIRAIPYFLWGNRTPGEMLVWIRKE